MAWCRGQAYGQDLRDRVLACSDMTLVQVAAKFGVSPSYVSKVRARLRDLGDAAPGLQHNHVPLRLAPFADALRTQIKASSDATLDELRAWLSETQKVSVSYPVMWKVVARLDLTRKKSTSRLSSSSATTSSRPVRPGRRCNRRLMQTASSSLMKPGPQRT